MVDIVNDGVDLDGKTVNSKLTIRVGRLRCSAKAAVTQ